MNYTLPGRHIKLFGKAVHCLSKIGEELYFENLNNGLSIRTVNSSRSAYGCFHFAQPFFVEPSTSSSQQDVDQQKIKVKISMKSCLGVFKSLSNLEKIVDYCKIEYSDEDCRLIFTLSCKHGIVKTHNLTFQECESLQAVFAKELCQNMIRSSARVLQDCVANFPAQCEEISLAVTPQHIKFKNYIEDDTDISKLVNTEMTLSPEEFEDCRIGLDTEITFCLKELRAIIAFSEAVNQPINVHFETGGRPVSFSMEGDNTFAAEFVLASLTDAPSESQHTEAAQTSRAVENGGRVPRHPTTDHHFQKELQTTRLLNSEGDFSGKNFAPANHISTIPSGHRVSSTPIEQEQQEEDDERSRNRVQRIAPVEFSVAARQNRGTSQTTDDFFTDSFPYRDVFPSERDELELPRAPSQNLNHSAPSHCSAPLTTPRPSQSGPNVSKVSLPRVGDSCPLADTEVEDGEGDNIPGTPPAKKHRLWLLGADSEQTEDGSRVVLAEDTDDEG